MDPLYIHTVKENSKYIKIYIRTIEKYLFHLVGPMLLYGTLYIYIHLKRTASISIYT